MGISIMEENRPLLEGRMTNTSYYYTLGNGKEALYKARKYGSGLPSPSRITPELIEAKNCLYKAFKMIASAEQIVSAENSK